MALAVPLSFYWLHVAPHLAGILGRSLAKIFLFAEAAERLLKDTPYLRLTKPLSHPKLRIGGRPNDLPWRPTWLNLHY
jgi:hypothetical protein